MSKTSYTDTKDDSTAVDLTRSDRYSLLSDARRRIALSLLAERGGSMGVGPLATMVAAREADATVPPEDLIERVEVSLHHAHLPKLAAHDVIEYDAETRRVERIRSMSSPPST